MRVLTQLFLLLKIHPPPQSRTSAALLSMCPKKVKDVASCHLIYLISICDIIDSE